LRDVIGGDGKSLLEHGGSVASEERTNEAIVLLANDALPIKFLFHCLASSYLAAPAVMSEQLLGIVAPSDAIGTAKARAGGT